MTSTRHRLVACARHLGLRADTEPEPWIEHGGLTKIAVACGRSRQLVSAWWQGTEDLDPFRPLPGEGGWVEGVGGRVGRPRKSP